MDRATTTKPSGLGRAGETRSRRVRPDMVQWLIRREGVPGGKSYQLAWRTKIDLTEPAATSIGSFRQMMVWRVLKVPGTGRGGSLFPGQSAIALTCRRLLAPDHGDRERARRKPIAAIGPDTRRVIRSCSSIGRIVGLSDSLAVKRLARAGLPDHSTIRPCDWYRRGQHNEAASAMLAALCSIADTHAARLRSMRHRYGYSGERSLR